VLDVALHGVSFSYGPFALRDLDLLFRGSTFTAVAGRGSSTLLKIVAGDLRPDAGEIFIGERPVTKLRRARRPLLLVDDDVDAPRRWSVRHALVAAVRQRTLDRVDRQQEFELALEKWRLADLAGQRIGTLSSTERALVHLAAIELRRPGILVADRPLARLNAPALRWAGEQFYRTLRVIGTTVIAATSSPLELGWADRLVVLEEGKLLQAGRPAQVFAAPLDEAAARATGDVNVIPLSIRGSDVESLIGDWTVENPPFQGTGVALARLDDFQIAAAGEESHFIFAIEEASFEEGRWIATGILSGGLLLRVVLPRSVPIEKGRLLPLRYEASRFTLVPKEMRLPERSVPANAVPPMRETR
jgi:ABC-type sugar transport system ATPase subunit